MTPPKIFISATSGDLTSARQIAKDALLTINCHPVEQTNFEPDWRSVTEMLRGKIGDCQALIHLVGFRYGAEPDPESLPPGTPRLSYTQMEYHLAREMGLRVYTFLMPETFPFDVPKESDGSPKKPEDQEIIELQKIHRDLIENSQHIYEKPANDLDLRTRLIALREQVISLVLEQQSIAKEVNTARHWGLWVAAASVLILGGIGAWQWRGQSHLTSQVQVVAQKQDEQTKLLKDQGTLLREAVVQLEQLTEEKSRLGIKITDIPRESVEKELAARVGVSAVELRLNIEAGKKSQDALTRAHANLLAGKLADAHAAAKEVRDAEAPAIQRIIQSHQVDGFAYYEEGEYEAGLDAFQRAAALVDKTSDPLAWADSQSKINNLLIELARYQEAEPLVREALRLYEACLGPDHEKTAYALNSLAVILTGTSQTSQAEPLLRKVLNILELKFGPNHYRVAVAVNNLSQVLIGMNRLTEAEPLLRRVVATFEKIGGDSVSFHAKSLSNLAMVMEQTKNMAEAEGLLRQALELDENNHGQHHPSVATHKLNLAGVLMAGNRMVEAEPLIRQALKSYDKGLGGGHTNISSALNGLASLLQSTNRTAEAEPLLRRALKIDEARFGADHPNVARDLNNLAQLLQASNRYTEAEPLSRRNVDILVAVTVSAGYVHPNLRAAVENHRALLRDLGLTESDTYAKLRDILGSVLTPAILGPFLVTVTEIDKGGLGEAIGLQAGDTFVSFNGQAITSLEQFALMFAVPTSEENTLEMMRAGKNLTFKIKSGKLSIHCENRPMPLATDPGPFQVVILEVMKGGQGEALGLQTGDVYLNYDGRAITSKEQLIQLAGESKREAIPLEVLRDGKKLNFSAKPGKLGIRIENRPLPPAATDPSPAK